MRDHTGIGLRLREKSVLTALRRSIPGDYESIEDVFHPALHEAGIDFTGACVLTDCPKSASFLFLGDTISERTEPVAGVIRRAGAWTAVLDKEAGGSLWLLATMDFPDRFIKLLPHGGGGCVMLRPLKAGWLVGFQATLLRSIIKNGRGNGDT